MPQDTKKILAEGRIRMRVLRAGMWQFQVFVVRRVPLDRDHSFTELFLDRMLGTDELKRVAEETGLPVEAQNGRAFPEGKGAKDFVDAGS